MKLAELESSLLTWSLIQQAFLKGLAATKGIDPSMQGALYIYSSPMNLAAAAAASRNSTKVSSHHKG